MRVCVTCVSEFSLSRTQLSQLNEVKDKDSAKSSPDDLASVNMNADSVNMNVDSSDEGGEFDDEINRRASVSQCCIP